MPKIISPEEKILMAGDAALIYFCGEKLMRDIANGQVTEIESTLQKADRGIANLRNWMKRQL